MSDGLRVDFSDVEGVKFEPVPPNWYRTRITDSEVRTGKDSGEDYLNVEFTIQEGEYTGKKFWTNVSFSQKSLPYTKAFLEDTGAFPDGLGTVSLPEVMAAIDGCEIDVKVTIDQEYDTNKVRRYRNVKEATSAAASQLP